MWKRPALTIQWHLASRLMLLLGAAFATWPCGAEVASPVRAYYYFVHWMSVGRTDLALEQFTVDARVVAGPACVEQSPCIGKAAIRAGYLAALERKQISLPLLDQRFDGRYLRARGETVLPHLPHARSGRLQRGLVFEFREGLIASVRTENRVRREDLVGTWSLESLTARGSDGTEILPLGESPKGFLTYTSSGYMSAVLMTTGRRRFASADVRGGTPEEVKQAFDGFDAYAGTYDVDEQQGRVTHFAEVARLPNWEGTAQIRHARVIGEHLHLVTPPILARGQEWVVEVSWRRAAGADK